MVLGGELFHGIGGLMLLIDSFIKLDLHYSAQKTRSVVVQNRIQEQTDLSIIASLLALLCLMKLYYDWFTTHPKMGGDVECMGGEETRSGVSVDYNSVGLERQLSLEYWSYATALISLVGPFMCSVPFLTAATFMGASTTRGLEKNADIFYKLTSAQKRIDQSF